VRLDYVFAPARDAARIARCEVVLDGADLRAASDHHPLYAEISEPPGSSGAPARTS
jgi:endonuclease/exonuclease/phosphatase family metal-dependent hydrolase